MKISYGEAHLPQIHQNFIDTNNAESLQKFLNGATIDICIDDTSHADEATLHTLQ